MWPSATVYVSLHEACEIFKNEKLRFGNPRHIAAKNKLRGVNSRSKAWDKQMVAEVVRILKEKYGAKCETSETFFGRTQLQST